MKRLPQPSAEREALSRVASRYSLGAASPLATITGRRAFSRANLALLLPPRPIEIAGFDAETDALVFER